MHKPVLVTGASSGIGEACAVLLARKGFRVFAGARRIARLKSLEGLGQGRITAVSLDVTDEDSIRAAVATIAETGAGLWGLVNNAGVSVTGPLEQVPIDDWRRQYETNVFGLVAMTQAVLPGMRAARAGRIVNIGSVAGRIAAPFMSAYASSKHAVEGLSDSLRRELAPFGVKVSLVRPGFINTPFGEPEQEGFARYAGPGAPYGARVAAFKSWHAKGHPAGASPFDVADCVHRALTAARPHSRYTVPARFIAPLLARNLLPSAAVDRAFAHATGLSKIDELG
jgi:NAD(P)-dependent dehydrogenase (short-subunit alcohol dehydrogenase family)